MALPETVPYLDWRWDDLVFLALAGIMLGAALLVVLGRDIIRSGLWLVLSFAGLAGIYALCGHSLAAVRVIQAVMGALTCVLLVRLGRQMFSARVGWLAGTLLDALTRVFTGTQGTHWEQHDFASPP